MKRAPFDYYAPTSVGEACSLIARYGSDAKLLAGGQSLVPLLSLRLAQPTVLIDLNGVPELAYIRADDGGVAIGAMTRQRAVEHSSIVREQCPILPAAVDWIGHPQIRNRATIGGSLVHSDPPSELPPLPPLLPPTFTFSPPPPPH